MKPALTLASGNPLRIMRAAKAAATDAGWTLAQWRDVAEECWACFAADEEAEQRRALDVLRAHFEVTLGPRFSWDPAEWDHRSTSAELWLRTEGES